MRNEKGQFQKGHHWRPAREFRSKDWLLKNYVQQGMSTGEIAAMFGVTDAAVIFWLRKHGIPRRSVSAARYIKHWGAVGCDNPMWNKRGELNPNWRGGVTAERQAFYSSAEWRTACAEVWKRDRATCRRCEMKKEESADMPFHIHHIIPFESVDGRADTGNLVLLCEACHQFVHSRKNVAREYLPKE